uniref:Conotoxin n=1 Tax=Conus betulinus TaxID=89764 RepID=A0A142C1G9_CONBE|nr:conotoxin [Conus betulinus]
MMLKLRVVVYILLVLLPLTTLQEKEDDASDALVKQVDEKIAKGAILMPDLSRDTRDPCSSDGCNNDTDCSAGCSCTFNMALRCDYCYCGSS